MKVPLYNTFLVALKALGWKKQGNARIRGAFDDKFPVFVKKVEDDFYGMYVVLYANKVKHDRDEWEWVLEFDTIKKIPKKPNSFPFNVEMYRTGVEMYRTGISIFSTCSMGGVGTNTNSLFLTRAMTTLAVHIDALAVTLNEEI